MSFDSIKCGHRKKWQEFIQIYFLLVFLTGIPLKVVGIFPTKNERKTLWKLLHDIYSCTSIYRYGRVELNLFVNEKECKVGY